ncbi:MAG: hypothetical protein RR475_02430 [Clostridia bacterium]
MSSSWLDLVKHLSSKKVRELRRALKDGKVIVISGLYGTGKSTLCQALQKCGYKAVEDFEVYNLVVDKPLFTPSVQGISERY